MDQLRLKHYNAKAQGGRLDIENINVRVQPSVFYKPKFKETDCYDEFDLSKNYYKCKNKHGYYDDDEDEYEDVDDSGFKPTENIRKYLLEFKQTGVFSCGGVFNDFPSSPGIHINNIGIIGLPLGEEQGKNITDKCSIAPFGRNEETIIDTNIRHTWQLDPSEFSIQNSTWESAMKSVVHQISCKLGCNPKFIRHNLYKLLIYGPGSFFKPHRDTEKEEGMFGTLVVILPSLYSGGQLIIKHCESVCEYDFSDKNSSLETNYAAFYADCEHEIKPITSGYRVCLVYNLINTEPNVMPTIEDNTETVQEIAKAVSEWSDTKDRCPELLIYGLEHRYTNAGLSFGGLKGKDVAILKLLKAVSKLVPLRVYLVNFEKNKWDQVDGNEESTYTKVTAWVSEAGRINITTAEGVGKKKDEEKEKDEKKKKEEEEQEKEEDERDEKDICGFYIHNRDFVQKDFWENKPADSDTTEYTGNEGINHNRFYHHTGIVFWPPQNKHLIFIRESIFSAVEYIERFNEPSDIQEIFSLFIRKIEHSEFKVDTFNLNRIVEILTKLGTKEQAIVVTDYVQEHMGNLIETYYDFIKFIKFATQLYKTFPTISKSPSFQSITKHIIEKLKKESYKKYENERDTEVIKEFKNLLDTKPNQGTKRLLEGETNEEKSEKRKVQK